METTLSAKVLRSSLGRKGVRGFYVHSNINEPEQFAIANILRVKIATMREVVGVGVAGEVDCDY